jgi:phage shock protein PspC (stress-responsive transcriptional regulator)
VAAFDPARWHRSHPDRRLAGVAAAVAHALAFPVNGVRLAFIVLTFVTHLGPLLYAALWLILPFAPGDKSPVERGLAAALDWVTRLRSEPPAPPPSRPANGADREEERFMATTLPGGPGA